MCLSNNPTLVYKLNFVLFTLSLGTEVEPKCLEVGTNMKSLQLGRTQTGVLFGKREHQAQKGKVGPE